MRREAVLSTVALALTAEDEIGGRAVLAALAPAPPAVAAAVIVAAADKVGKARRGTDAVRGEDDAGFALARDVRGHGLAVVHGRRVYPEVLSGGFGIA